MNTKQIRGLGSVKLTDQAAFIKKRIDNNLRSVTELLAEHTTDTDREDILLTTELVLSSLNEAYRLLPFSEHGAPPAILIRLHARAEELVREAIRQGAQDEIQDKASLLFRNRAMWRSVKDRFVELQREPNLCGSLAGGWLRDVPKNFSKICEAGLKDGFSQFVGSDRGYCHETASEAIKPYGQNLCERIAIAMNVRLHNISASRPDDWVPAG